MYKLILLSFRLQFLLVLLVIFKLVEDLGLSISSSDCLILDFYFVGAALIDKLLVLGVADLALGTGLKLLPGFFFDPGAVGVEVLSLEFDLLEFLGETVLLLLLVLLLLADLVIDFKQALVSGRFHLSL